MKKTSKDVKKASVKVKRSSANVVDSVQSQPVTAQQVPVVLEDAKIWGEIKDKPIDMFALPNQVVSNFFEYKQVEPSKCYLSCKTAGAAIPALEAALGPKYKIDMVDKFVVVSRVPKAV